MVDDVFQMEWERQAGVRTVPRIPFEPCSSRYFYPLSRQPLSVHPYVYNRGEGALSYLLVQSLYKYANDISIIETRVVNKAVLSAISNALPIEFSATQKRHLFTILVDEAYHAYAAYDMMQEIQHHVLIEPLLLPETIEIERAISSVKQGLDARYHGLFELIAVCIAENTLTKDMVGMLDHEETHPFFQKHIAAHLADESRHAKLFFHLLKYIWHSISEDAKEHIGRSLPEFLTLYLGLSIQIEFEKRVLLHIGLTEHQADEALQDTYLNFQLTPHHPMLKNILTFLSRAGVLDKVTEPGFRAKGWM